MKEYGEDEFLMISGIQHFSFCRRQWALIHLECQWQENLRTVEGKIVHEKCHDASFTEKRRDLLVCRGLRVYSARLGATGQCDVVEFSQAESGAVLHGREGFWRPCPIEYKRGKPKADASDMLQLCAQAVCLEDMLCCEIPSGYLYYDEIHRRETVVFTSQLRQEVFDTFSEMRSYFARGYTPKAKFSKKCNACSLRDLCLPKLAQKPSVSAYYQSRLEDN